MVITGTRKQWDLPEKLHFKATIIPSTSSFTIQAFTRYSHYHMFYYSFLFPHMYLHLNNNHIYIFESSSPVFSYIRTHILSCTRYSANNIVNLSKRQLGISRKFPGVVRKGKTQRQYEKIFAKNYKHMNGSERRVKIMLTHKCLISNCIIFYMYTRRNNLSILFE